MNLPNKLTTMRIALIPIFVMQFYFGDLTSTISIWGCNLPLAHYSAAVIFILLSLTDWLDGYIARKQNLVTNLGKFLDPLADKMLTAAGFVMLVELQFIPAWVVIIVLCREFAVTGLRVVAASEGHVIAAARGGKLKTALQMIVIILGLFHVSGLAMTGLIYLMAFVTFYSGLEYFVKNDHVFKNSK